MFFDYRPRNRKKKNWTHNLGPISLMEYTVILNILPSFLLISWFDMILLNWNK